MVIVSVDKAEEFLHKYHGLLPEHIFSGVEDVVLGLRRSAEIPDKELEKWDTEVKKRKEKEQLLVKTAERNNAGIKAEERGQIQTAIKYYEENIKQGYPSTLSFERLLKLYRKAKNYADEMRVINRCLEVFAGVKHKNVRLKLAERKEKLDSLLQKSCLTEKQKQDLQCLTPDQCREAIQLLQTRLNEPVQKQP